MLSFGYMIVYCSFNKGVANSGNNPNFWGLALVNVATSVWWDPA